MNHAEVLYKYSGIIKYCNNKENVIESFTYVHFKTINVKLLYIIMKRTTLLKYNDIHDVWLNIIYYLH